MFCGCAHLSVFKPPFTQLTYVDTCTHSWLRLSYDVYYERLGQASFPSSDCIPLLFDTHISDVIKESILKKKRKQKENKKNINSSLHLLTVKECEGKKNARRSCAYEVPYAPRLSYYMSAKKRRSEVVSLLAKKKKRRQKKRDINVSLINAVQDTRAQRTFLCTFSFFFFVVVNSLQMSTCSLGCLRTAALHSFFFSPLSSPCPLLTARTPPSPTVRCVCRSRDSS